MTFDDDFIQVEFQGGTRRFPCKSIGVEWPPPERLALAGFDLRRVSHSGITDEQRKGMDLICRGALYEVAA